LEYPWSQSSFIYGESVIMVSVIRRLRKDERGQGLVEYALILALVAVVVIGVTAILGQSIVKVFCSITLQIAPDTDTPVCEKLAVNCSGVADGATVTGPIPVEAVVTDLAPPLNVEKVSFYVDGVLYREERIKRYCMATGDGSCNGYDTSGLSSGWHTISAVAVDGSNNTGTCSVKIRIP
jgi:pilus assembly protein Flp/PilA